MRNGKKRTIRSWKILIKRRHAPAKKKSQNQAKILLNFQRAAFWSLFEKRKKKFDDLIKAPDRICHLLFPCQLTFDLMKTAQIGVYQRIIEIVTSSIWSGVTRAKKQSYKARRKLEKKIYKMQKLAFKIKKYIYAIIAK